MNEFKKERTTKAVLIHTYDGINNPFALPKNGIEFNDNDDDLNVVAEE